MFWFLCFNVEFCTGIAWQKQAFRDFLDNYDNYRQFSETMSTATCCPTPEIARMVQERMVRQLRAWGEYGAAVWFQTFWCGNCGTWTMGDAGIGHTPHSNGVEGNWPHFTQAVCDSAGKSRQLHLDVFAGNMIKYITDISKETALKHLQAYGSHRFLVNPQLLPRQWKALQNLDVRHMQHALVIGTKEHASTWAGSLEGSLHE